MFCCAAELGMMVFGIVTLVKGKFALSKSHVVTGPPAYVIGALLTATIPILFMIGFVVGLSAAAQGHQPDPTEYAWIDLTIVPVILVTVLIIALTSGKAPSRRKIATPFDSAMPPLPEDPNNPYYSPQADQRKPPEDSPPPGF